jgi:hypothetical protein
MFKINFILLTIAITLLLTFVSAHPAAHDADQYDSHQQNERQYGRAAPKQTPIQTVYSLIERRFPDYKNNISLTLTTDTSGATSAGTEFGSYTISAGTVENNIVITGTNAIMLSCGLNYYLKKYLNINRLWWSESNSNNVPVLPALLPSITVTETITATTKYQYYENVCTVSYSSVWWQWPRWEKEIDWMAMNGINLALAFTGQEKIWEITYARLGINVTQLDNFFGGKIGNRI